VTLLEDVEIMVGCTPKKFSSGHVFTIGQNLYRALPQSEDEVPVLIPDAQYNGTPPRFLMGFIPKDKLQLIPEP